MTKWERRIQLREFLGDDDSADGIKKSAEGILSRLPASAPTRQISKAKDMADEDPETALLVFNDGMDKIYDWADANRVWIE